MVPWSKSIKMFQNRLQGTNQTLVHMSNGIYKSKGVEYTWPISLKVRKWSSLPRFIRIKTWTGKIYVANYPTDAGHRCHAAGEHKERWSQVPIYSGYYQ